MDTITTDLVYKFASELKKLLETLEKQFGRDLSKAFKSKELIEQTNFLVLDLYKSYMNTFELLLIEDAEEINIIIKNTNNKSIFIVKDFFLSNNYPQVKENFDVNILLMKRASISWEEFTFRLTHLLDFTKPKVKFLSSNILEKIRFFMIFINKFPDYITENKVPLEAKNFSYNPIYANWGKNASYYTIYKKYIHRNTSFFKNHIRINPIPQYKFWGLNMIFLESEFLLTESIPERVSGYPLQTFENIDGSYNSSLFLIDKNYLINNKKDYQNVMIEKFSIINNFNHFKHIKTKNNNQKLQMDPFFESHAQFIDDLHNLDVDILLKYKNYEFTIDFKKEEKLTDLVNSVKNIETIKLFNTLYDINNNFKQKYSSNNYPEINPYRVLFQNRYTFPDFNFCPRFLLKIRKKKNVIFQNSALFFKYWSNQCLIYETKEKLIYYGFLQPNFNYKKEISYIKEFLDSLSTEYEFLINNKDIYQSTLSLYSLPNSNQFLENEKIWNLKSNKINMTIQQKEDEINNQMNGDLI